MDLEILFWPKDADVRRILREGNVVEIIRLLGHPDPLVQQKATDTLVALGNPVVPSLIYELVHWRLSVRIGAAEALGAIGAREAVEPLIERLRKDAHSEVRFAAAMSLGSIGDPAAVNPLITALRDPDKYVRNGAAHALDMVQWQAPEPSILAYYYIALQEWDSLVALGEVAGAPLMWALKDQDPKVRTAVVDTVGRINSQVVMLACSLALKDRDPEVRKKAAQVFPKCGIPLTLLPMGLSKRPKTKPSPFIAALLNLMFLGIGYNYLGYWFGLLVFQCFITINLMMVAVTGSSLPLLLIPLFSVPYSIPFSYHAWHLARKIPDI